MDSLRRRDLRWRWLLILFAYLVVWLVTGLVRGDALLRRYLAECDPFCSSGDAQVQIYGGFPPFWAAKLDYGHVEGSAGYLGHQLVLLEPITGFVLRLAVG